MSFLYLSKFKAKTKQTMTEIIWIEISYLKVNMYCSFLYTVNHYLNVKLMTVDCKIDVSNTKRTSHSKSKSIILRCPLVCLMYDTGHKVATFRFMF